MKNRKGMTSIEIIIALVMGAAVLFFLFILLRKSITPAQDLSNKLSELDDAACKAKGIVQLPPKDADVDGDLRHDLICDICVCNENKCLVNKNSDNEIDKDGDGIPDGCDELADPKNPESIKKTWVVGCDKTSPVDCSDITTGYCLRKIGPDGTKAQCYYKS